MADVIAAVLMCYAFWDFSEHIFLLVWCSMHVVFSLVLLIFIRKAKEKSTDVDQVWVRHLFLWMLVFGFFVGLRIVVVSRCI